MFRLFILLALCGHAAAGKVRVLPGKYCAQREDNSDASLSDVGRCAGYTIWLWNTNQLRGSCFDNGYVEPMAHDCSTLFSNCTCWYPPTPTPTITHTETQTATVDMDCSCRCRNQWTGGACDICDLPYDGDFCNECAAGYITYPKCIRCSPTEHCNGRGTAYVQMDTCKCSCSTHWEGDHCESCSVGYAGVNCNECDIQYIKDALGQCELCTPVKHCSSHATFATTLPTDPNNCFCQCSDYWEGPTCADCDPRFEQVSCAECATGRFSKPSCLPCTTADYCNNRAVSAEPSINKLSCICVGCDVPWTGSKCEVCPGQYQGTQCDQCVTGRHSWPACTLCDTHLLCNGNADSTTSDGKICTCLCRNQWYPPQNCTLCDSIYDSSKDCGACAPGRVGYPVCAMCTSEEHCNGRASHVYPNANSTQCICECGTQWTDVHCGTCPPHFSGTNCDQCASGHVDYNNTDDAKRCRLCTNELDCSGNAVALLVTSDKTNENCVCKCTDMWSGADCSICISQFNADDNCASCSEGRINYPLCYECQDKQHCNSRAITVKPSEEKDKCICECSNQWEGDSCAECPRQFDANNNCASCAVHYFNSSNSSTELVCSPVVPYQFQLRSTNERSFVDFNQTLYPPIVAELQDGAEKPIKGVGEEVNCTCALYECQKIQKPFRDTLPYGYISDPGSIPCDETGCGDAAFEDRRCKVISKHIHFMNGTRGCVCDKLFPTPPEEEFKRGEYLKSVNGEHASLTWYMPRMYLVVLSLNQMDSSNDNETGVTIMPLVVPLPQPYCFDTSKLALPGRGDLCTDCPTGLICDGTLSANVQKNWWRFSAEVLTPDSCPFGTCIGSNESNTSASMCAPKTNGTFCGECEGTGRVGPTGCVQCFSKLTSIVLTFLSGVGILTGVLCVVRLSLKNTIEKPDPLPQFVKILMSCIQVLAILRPLNLKWGSGMEDILQTSSSANSLSGIPTPTICLLPENMDLNDRLWVWVLLPLFSCAEAWFASFVFSGKPKGRSTIKWQSQFYESANAKTGSISQEDVLKAEIIPDCAMCSKEFADFKCTECKTLVCRLCSRACSVRQHKLDPDYQIPLEGTAIELPKRQIFATALLILIHFSYTLLIDQLTKPFICNSYLHPERGTIRVAQADPRVECDEESLLYRLSLAFFCLYGIGFPLAFAIMLTYEKQHLSTQRCLSSFGFLYVNYRKGYYYWESVVLLRKVLIVLSVAMPSTTFAKCFSATWVLFISLTMNLICEPYRDIKQQRLDSLGLFSGACTLLAALWVADERYGEPLLVGIAILYSLTIVVIVVVILWLVIGRFYGTRSTFDDVDAPLLEKGFMEEEMKDMHASVVADHDDTDTQSKDYGNLFIPSVNTIDQLNTPGGSPANGTSSSNENKESLFFAGPIALGPATSTLHQSPLRRYSRDSL
eukprot:TRINITY_DN16901_c0_g1_i1.p1 TRINITY_DN16901_c0_g1~~TRINITY_DN16901_c0_g1_i1.p1  ORF type:complete len:1419 (+),score=116.81 TRINITY_DN16901_c0_g1_i1:44-4300(+)